MAFVYKNITFSKELNCSLEDFISLFENQDAFKQIPHLEKGKELEKIWKQVMKANGNNTNVTRKSKKTNSNKSKKGFI